jgi:WXXGXW repeat (2 copies)/Domain of unknown function (DUF4124)
MRSTNDLPWPLCLGFLCVTAAAGVLQAGEVYKSIDADGKVVYSDHLDPSLSQTTTVQLEDPHSLPGQLHFCWTNCFTLVLDNGIYHRADGTDESWTVETFSTDAIVLHRHDPPVAWNGYSEDVVYAGHVSNDRLIDVTVNGKPVSGIDASWGPALTTLPGTNAERDAMTAVNRESSSGDTVSSAATPPPVPAEDQPPLDQDGYLWTPGYWYWRDRAYLWVPGTWVRPPRVGLFWTPAYWGSAGTVYVFHPGHWGSTVGFYGGVNYGHGYFGSNYSGGHWIGNSFAYNSTVNHVDPAIAHHTYTESVADRGSRPRHPSPSTTVERTSEAGSMPMKADMPPTVVKTPAPSVPKKLNHHTPTRAAPVK